MITKDNLEYVLKDLSPEYIQENLDKEGDYIEVWVHIFNAGSSTSLSSYNYDEEIEQEANDNGMLFLDKDDFLMLLEEVEHNFNNQ